MLLRLKRPAPQGPQRERVLVLCTGNSCRSIMAEALVNERRRNRYEAYSAGSRPAGFVHPKALQTLRRRGIAPGEPRSKSWDEFAGQAFDYVITVCSAAAAEPCPVFPGKVVRLHWDIPDPALAEGPPADVAAAFEAAFRRLERHVEEELP